MVNGVVLSKIQKDIIPPLGRLGVLTNPPGLIGKIIFIGIFSLVFGLALSVSVEAADIDGEVEVWRDFVFGTKPLKSFANAVVYLDGFHTPPPQKPALINQENKQFIPRLLPVIKGQEVRFLNSDNVRHNVFSPDKEEPFDLARYPKGEYKSLKFNVLGDHKIYCNIHQKMIADVFVLSNHYYNVTDSEGHFTIKNVPPGEYTIKVWHILGGAAEKKIRVADEPLSLSFTLKSKKSFRQIKDHTNKFGESYGRSRGY
jgi:hypothetical protein